MAEMLQVLTKAVKEKSRLSWLLTESWGRWKPAGADDWTWLWSCRL